MVYIEMNLILRPAGTVQQLQVFQTNSPCTYGLYLCSWPCSVRKNGYPSRATEPVFLFLSPDTIRSMKTKEYAARPPMAVFATGRLITRIQVSSHHRMHLIAISGFLFVKMRRYGNHSPSDRRRQPCAI